MSEEQRSDSKLVRLTGLWKNKDKKGGTYLSGGLGAARVLILANTHKKNDSEPDYIAYLAPVNKPNEAPSEIE